MKNKDTQECNQVTLLWQKKFNEEELFKSRRDYVYRFCKTTDFFYESGGY